MWPGGVTGTGTTVAFFDSGVDGANAMLSSRWRGRRTTARAAWFDPFRGAGEPQDLNGHGTQVAAAADGYEEHQHHGDTNGTVNLETARQDVAEEEDESQVLLRDDRAVQVQLLERLDDLPPLPQLRELRR